MCFLLLSLVLLMLNLTNENKHGISDVEVP